MFVKYSYFKFPFSNDVMWADALDQNNIKECKNDNVNKLY